MSVIPLVFSPVHNCHVPAWDIADCGNKALWDSASENGYVCTACFAVIGSVSMPYECRQPKPEEKELNQ